MESWPPIVRPERGMLAVGMPSCVGYQYFSSHSISWFLCFRIFFAFGIVEFCFRGKWSFEKVWLDGVRWESDTDFFAASSKAFDDFAVQLEWEWWFGSTVGADDGVARAVWTHLV